MYAQSLGYSRRSSLKNSRDTRSRRLRKEFISCSKQSCLCRTITLQPRLWQVCPIWYVSFKRSKTSAHYLVQPVPAPAGLVSNGNSNGNVHGTGLNGHMDGTDMLGVMKDPFPLIIQACTDHGATQDFGQDLEGLDLTNIAEWDLEAFWNF